MNVLLDTNALLVLADGPLPKRAAEAFGLADFAFASPVSAWEVAIKFHLGKLNISPSPLDWFHTLCDRYHLTILPIATETLCAAAALPPIHRDPFDRVLIATARHRHLTILTADRIIPTYPDVQTLW